MESSNRDVSQLIHLPITYDMSFPWHNPVQNNLYSKNTVHYPGRGRFRVLQTAEMRRNNNNNRNNNPSRVPLQRPKPGQTEVYGAIIKCLTTNRYCLVQGSKTGKWSFPKGHRNKISEDPLIMEDPYACMIREVAEEIGIDNLPMPKGELAIRVGYYYLFEVRNEMVLTPRDTVEVGSTGWFTIEEMATLNLNIDANVFRVQKSRNY
jgi:8-oxo-dGTP pyrophosphatase MutT (NUDIX family)